MAKLSKRLVGPYGYDRIPPVKELNPFMTLRISIADIDDLMERIEAFGNTLPYSGYSGFFRLVYVSERQGGFGYRSLSPIVPTLAQAATYVLDFHGDSLEDYVFDPSGPTMDSPALALDIVFLELKSAIEKKPIQARPYRPRGMNGKFRKLTAFEKKYGKEQPRDKSGRFKKGKKK